MPKSIKDITTEDIQDLFDSIIYLRGEEYFEEDCVQSIEPIDSSTLAGVVRGNRDYNVTITIDSEEDVSCECSCPCDFNCKHAAALLLKWLQVKGVHNKGLKEAKLQKKESVKDILDKKSKEELVGLLTEFLSKHPELKLLVKIERKEIVTKIRHLLSDSAGEEVSDLISQLKIILEGIKRNKNSWDSELLNEMEICSEIMVEGQENVHDEEGDLGVFLDDWLLLYGEIFSSLKPSKQEKREFLQKVMKLMQKDEYGLDCFERAFIGMCTSKEDIDLIKEAYKPNKQRDEEYYEEEQQDYEPFYLELYDKIGCNEDYLKIARKSGFSLAVIDKLISLKKWEEALEECKKAKNKENFEDIDNRTIEILKKLGRKEEVIANPLNIGTFWA